MTALGQKLVAGTDNFYVLLKPGGSIQSGIALYNFYGPSLRRSQCTTLAM